MIIRSRAYRVGRLRVVEFELDDVKVLEFGLDECPAGDAPIRRHSVEIPVFIKVVWLPLDLPDRVCVLAGLSC